MSRKSIVWAVVAAVSLLIPAAAMFVWQGQGWPAVLFVVWTIGAAAAFVASDRRSERRRHARMLELMQNSAIETLSHHRHDWMNELQILYGYLRLGKPDKAVAVVDRIRRRMEQDSRISRLGAPKLAAFFLSFRTVCDTMRLEVDVEEGFGVKDLGLDGERLTSAVIGLVNVMRFRAVASMDEENVLRLDFRSEGRQARLVMTYEGKLAAEDSLAAELERVLNGFGRLTEENRSDPEMAPAAGRTIVVAFPLEERAV